MTLKVFSRLRKLELEKYSSQHIEELFRKNSLSMTAMFTRKPQILRMVTLQGRLALCLTCYICIWEPDPKYYGNYVKYI